MLTIQYRKSIPRYVWVNLVGRRFSRVLTGRGGFLRLAKMPEPKLPTPSWVRVRPLLSGICGSDLSAVAGRSGLYLSAFISFPFVPGHEVVGRVIETGSGVTGVEVGDRVVIEPALGCAVRGVQDVCRPCREGHYANCERVLEGDVSAGIQTGFCRDTGGGWGEQLVAHEWQLHRVPDNVPDEAAVLTEPLSCAVHGVLGAKVSEGERVLVVGCGSIGLLTIAALRALAPRCTIVAVAKYAHQQELAKALGADHLALPGQEGYEQLAQVTGATIHPLPLGKPAVLGGFDIAFECAGAPAAVEDAMRWTRSQGRVVVMGMPTAGKLDLTPFWYQELDVRGAYLYSLERGGEGQVRTFQLTLDLLSREGYAERLGALVRHRFPLSQYRRAIATAISPGRSGSVKAVFDFTE